MMKRGLHRLDIRLHLYNLYNLAFAFLFVLSKIRLSMTEEALDESMPHFHVCNSTIAKSPMHTDVIGLQPPELEVSTS